MQTKKYILSYLVLAICYGSTFLIATPTFAQTTTNKRQIFIENGRTLSNGITVHFKQPLFNVAEGKQTAKLSDFKVEFEPIKQYFSDLEKQHEEIIFYKLIPSAKWGDVWRKHVRTAELVKITDMSQLYSIEFKKAVAIDEIIAELESMEDIIYAHPPVQTLALKEPNDNCYNDVTPCFTSPSFSDQWNLKKVDAEKAWDLTTGDPDVIVAIVDPGNFVTTHPDLQNKFILSANTNTQGTSNIAHSNAVSGVVAAETDNSIGIASLGWNIRIKPFAFNDAGIPGSTEAQLIAAYNDNAVKIINCSFVTKGAGGCEESFNSIKTAVGNAIAMGKIVIAATGNLKFPGPCGFPFRPTPADYNSVIGVAATTFADGHPSNYNYGREWTDVSAPGFRIVTTEGLGYNQISGTSFAAPLVSALAGLMLSINPDLTRVNVTSILKSTAENLGNPDFFGAGRINAYEALKYTLENYGGTLSGDVLLTEDLTIASGKTLTIEDGTTIEFDSGVKLTINGTLDVNGTSANPVTFDRSGGSDWYGILINSSSGSSSNILYAKIKNANYGLSINGASPTVSNTMINYCGTGVLIQNGAAPKFTNSTITYSDYNGVACYGGATPSFGVFPTWGDNVIRRNGDRGVYAAYSCTVFLGQNTLPPSGGRNSIYENYNANGYQASILYGSTSMAEKNWWGSSSPSSSIFENPSAIDYNPWWTGSDPHSSRPLTGAINADTETSPVADDNELNETDSLNQQLWQAFILYQKAKYDSAMQISRDIIKLAPLSDEAFSALNVLRISHAASGKPGLEGYLTQLIAKHVGEEMAGVARLNLAWYALGQDNATDALVKLQDNIVSFSNNAVERITLFQKMVVYLLNLGDRQSAEAAFSELQTKYPNDPLVVEAQRLLGKSTPQNQQKQLTKLNTAELQRSSTALSSHPNPFNPETRIQYQIPEASLIQLRIYNLMGQEIRTLVQEQQNPGTYSVVWDGKNDSGIEVSSGVYIYQVTVQPNSPDSRPFQKNGKMLLVR